MVADDKFTVFLIFLFTGKHFLLVDSFKAFLFIPGT